MGYTNRLTQRKSRRLIMVSNEIFFLILIEKGNKEKEDKTKEKKKRRGNGFPWRSNRLKGSTCLNKEKSKRKKKEYDRRDDPDKRIFFIFSINILIILKRGGFYPRNKKRGK
jgi:hypothetical protein